MVYCVERPHREKTNKERERELWTTSEEMDERGQEYFGG